MGSFENFDKEFEQSERWFWRIWYTALTFIGFGFVAIICAWVAYGVVAYKTVTTIEHDGLKSVLERVWEGDRHE